MKEDTFFDNKNMYFGTLIFENTAELSINEDIPPVSYTHLEISDERSVGQVFHDLQAHGLQPVMNDYVYV